MSSAVRSKHVQNNSSPTGWWTFGEHALPMAMTIARRAGATLRLLRVQPPLGSIYAEFAPVSANESLSDHRTEVCLRWYVRWRRQREWVAERLKPRRAKVGCSERLS